MKIKNIIRNLKFKFQKIFNGFGDDELWSLDISLAKLILPRLKKFKENHCSVPMHLSDEEWNNHLNKMIYSFEYIANEKAFFNNPPEVQEGLNLFAKYYLNLWD